MEREEFVLTIDLKTSERISMSLKALKMRRLEIALRARLGKGKQAARARIRSATAVGKA